MPEPHLPARKVKGPWRWEEDGLTVTRGSAWSGPGCHNGCGVLMYTDKKGTLVKIEGDPTDPYNFGRLCPRCFTVPETTYLPTRLKYPMKRVGERGENKWERISWDEALDTVAEKFNGYKKEFGAESVLFCHGTGRDIFTSSTRLCNSFGSPNNVYFLSGQACYVPRTAVMLPMMGDFALTDVSQHSPLRYDDPAWKLPECILLWGNEPLNSNADCFFGHWIVDCMKRGSKLITVDPRTTWLASKSEHHLQIRPGTDAALALGMIDIIVKEDLYDHAFVENWTLGFDKLAERAAEYPLERVAKITGILAETILAATRMYARSKPATTQWGLALDSTKEALGAAHGVVALWSITGNVEIPGGMALTRVPYGVSAPVYGWGQELLPAEQAVKRIGAQKYPLIAEGWPLVQSDMMIETMLTGKPYPIKAAWLATTNPLSNTAQEPDTKMLPALRNLDFVVVVDLFMTPTAVACADMVLPAATYPEKDSVRSWWYDLKTINKAIEPVGECKSDQEIALLLGKRIAPEAWPWKDVEGMSDAMLESAGVTFKQLRDEPLYANHQYRKHEKGLLREDGSLGFNTPSGRIELYSSALEGYGLDPLPYFEEPLEGPVATPELMKEYPFILTTGARHVAYFHSEGRQIPHLRALQPDPLAWINSDSAAKLGILDGEWVWIENLHGKCKMRAKVTPLIHPQFVSLPHGWYFPEKPGEGPSWFGAFESNSNVLVPRIPGKSGFGSNSKALICKVYPVTAQERGL